MRTDMAVAAVPAPSRWELGKAERRRRIVAAAAALVRENAYNDVSMIQIAQRAEVAPATLYNLFATKAAIFLQVFDLDLAAFEQSLTQAAGSDPLERVFQAIELVAMSYERDPAFNRALARATHDQVEHLGAAIRKPRMQLWETLVAQIVAAGQLQPDTDPRLLSMALWQLMRGVFQDWASGAITAERFAQESAYGVCLMLQAYASEASAIRLRQRAAGLRQALSAAI